MPKPATSLLCAMILPAVVGCGKTATANSSSGSPEALLKLSMDRYHQAKWFSAEEAFKMSSPELINASATRTIAYETPNKFRIVTEDPHGQKLFCTSDGKKELDYASDPHVLAQSADSPVSLASPTAVIMKNPLRAGSLLYLFFGGSENIGLLEQQGVEPAAWGADGVAPSGEKTKQVKFLCIGNYGHAVATIGVDTGLVYQLEYDCSPQVTQFLQGKTPAAEIELMKQELPKIPAGKKHDAIAHLISMGPSAFTMDVVEKFDNPTFTSPATPALFDVSLPQGYKLAPPPPDGNAPVPVGHKAPDIVVNDSSGKPVRLSSLRGQTVLIDFWATWCGPCKEGLPFTVALGEKFAHKGLKVLAVSAEQPSVINDFVKGQSYKLQAYNDPGQAASLAYHVNSLPTTVVIDSKGNLADYFVGLHDPAYIQQSLLGAGFKGG